MLNLKRSVFASAIVAATIFIGGCQTAPEYEGVTFVEPVSDISSAFFGGAGSLYVVPEKGVLVDRIYTDSGVDLKWSTSGSYLLLAASDLLNLDAITFTIEGRARRMLLTPKTQKQ